MEEWEPSKNAACFQVVPSESKAIIFKAANDEDLQLWYVHSIVLVLIYHKVKRHLEA
jgi:hypothetical protein